jgi:hypothetical protein
MLAFAETPVLVDKILFVTYGSGYKQSKKRTLAAPLDMVKMLSHIIAMKWLGIRPPPRKGL